jgi:hypothetical protein
LRGEWFVAGDWRGLESKQTHSAFTSHGLKLDGAGDQLQSVARSFSCAQDDSMKLELSGTLTFRVQNNKKFYNSQTNLELRM